MNEMFIVKHRIGMLLFEVADAHHELSYCERSKELIKHIDLATYRREQCVW